MQDMIDDIEKDIAFLKEHELDKEMPKIYNIMKENLEKFKALQVKEIDRIKHAYNELDFNEHIIANGYLNERF